jgi:hypothetical protein
LTTPYVLKLTIGLACDAEVLVGVRRALQSFTSMGGVEFKWRELECSSDGHSVRVVCEGVGSGLEAVKDAAVSAAAAASRSVAPGREPSVTVRGVGIVLPPRPAILSTEDRWGWYRVTVSVSTSMLADDPELGEYMKTELPKMQRFRAHSVEWSSGSEKARLTVLTFARSPNAAFFEASDAVERLIVGAVRDPGDYSVEPEVVEWVAPA